MTTPNLELPEFGSAGIPDGPTITDGNRALDAIVQLSVIDILATPPASPLLGQRYIVDAAPTGDWAGKALRIAYYTQSGWEFRTPRDGWFGWVSSEDGLYRFDESVPAWVLLMPADIAAALAAVVATLDLVMDATVLTEDDETTVFPNSRMLTAGANITIDTSVAGELELAASGGGGGGSANVTPDTHPGTPNTHDDEFEVGSTIDTAGTRFSGAQAWTAFGLSTGSNDVVNGSLLFKPALTASRNLGGYSQPVSGSWGYTCKLNFARYQTNTLLGMFVARSTAAGAILVFGFNAAVLVVQRLSNNTTFSANQLLTANQISATTLHTDCVYQRITYDGTTLRFFISWSGVEGTFIEVYSETSAAFLGGAPALIGLGGDNEHATIQTFLICDWFRKTS